MKYLLYVSFLLLPFISNSQNYADPKHYLVDSLDLDAVTKGDRILIDSCLANYHKAKDDTSRINAITVIIEESWDDNVWPKYNMWGFNFVTEKLKFSHPPEETLVLQKSLAGALNNIGFFAKHQGDVLLALEYFHKSLKILEKVRDKKRIATSYNNIGFIYKDQGDVPLALEYYHKSLKIKEGIGDKQGMANSYNNIGVTHYTQGDIPLALEYYHKSLKIREEIGNKSGVAISYNNIGVIHYVQGDTSLTLKYYHKSLEIQEEIGDKQGISESYNNIGVIHYAQGDMPLALEYYHKSLKIREEIGNKKGMANSYNNIAIIRQEQGKLLGSEGALAFASKSLALSQEIGYPLNIKGASGLLSKIYSKQGRYQKALEMRNLEIQMKDSLASEETIKATANQQAKYEYEKQKTLNDKDHEKEVAIKDAEKKRQTFISWSVSIGLFLIIIFSFILVKRLRISNTQKLIIEQKNTENELLLGEIHHRVKNNLQVISSLLGLQERNINDPLAKAAISEGKERVKSMGLIHKMLYQNDNYSGVEMDDYVKKLVTGLLDSFGVDDTNFNLDIDFSKLKLDVDTAIPMGLIINELVINALKYAYNNTTNPALKINLKQKKNELFLEITDNGTGKASDVNNSKSFGLKLVKSLSRQLGGTLLIQNNNGLSIQINIRDYKLV